MHLNGETWASVMFKYHNTKLAQKHFLISLLSWLRLIFSPHILKERKLFLCVSHKHLRQSMLVLQKRSFSDIFRKFVNERAQGLVASSYHLEVLSENMLASRQKLILIKDFLHCLIFYVAWKLKISHSERAVQSFGRVCRRLLKNFDRDWYLSFPSHSYHLQ